LYLYTPSELTLGVDAAGNNGPSAADSSHYAERLAELVRGELPEGDLAAAYSWAHELLCFAPRHEDARRWLGLPGRPTAASTGDKAAGLQLRKPRRPHPRYPWAAGQYLLATTPHFRIATNDSEASARQLAEALERLHCAWQQLFFATWHEETPWIAAPAARGVPRRAQSSHQVVLFRSHDDYVAHLRTIEPRAAVTRGYYHAATRTAYFVGGEHPATATWYHEATHQLFHERQRTAREVGHASNFWIVEGIAMYLESLHHRGPRLGVGGLEADRLQMARYRALREGFFVPLDRFTAFGQAEWQAHPRIHAIYSQAAGLTHFLIHAEQGRYRPVVESLLRLVYAGKDEPASLFELAAASPAELEASYRRFLAISDDDLAHRDSSVPIRQLCLGGTRVSNAGFAQLGPLAACEWLDLFGLPLTDADTGPLDQTPRLRQLSLENTSIGDSTVRRLAAARELRELDLSSSRITDASLETLAQLDQLQTVWLANTGVTDRGAGLLESLPQLQLLDLQGTQVTAATREAWKRRLAERSPSGPNAEASQGPSAEASQDQDAAGETPDPRPRR
jgi:hypothetical protein